MEERGGGKEWSRGVWRGVGGGETKKGRKSGGKKGEWMESERWGKEEKDGGVGKKKKKNKKRGVGGGGEKERKREVGVEGRWGEERDVDG